MNKLIKIIQAIMGLFKAFSGKPQADVSDKNVNTVRVGLDLADKKDPEVANAKHRLDQIQALPEKEREARASEVREMEQLVERKVKAVVPKDKKSVMDQLRAAEEAERSKS